MSYFNGEGDRAEICSIRLYNHKKEYPAKLYILTEDNQELLLRLTPAQIDGLAEAVNGHLTQG